MSAYDAREKKKKKFLTPLVEGKSPHEAEVFSLLIWLLVHFCTRKECNTYVCKFGSSAQSRMDDNKGPTNNSFEIISTDSLQQQIYH